MVWYVAIVAVLNLGLGYALAIYLGAGRKLQVAAPVGASALLESPEMTDHFSEDAFSLEMNADSVDAGVVTDGLAAEVGALPADASDAITGLVTREYIEKRLTDMTIAHADLQPMTVALVEIDEAIQGAEAVDDRLLRGVAETVCELLTDAHMAGRYSDQQFLLLLPHDDVQHATQRTEQVRQRVAATQYVADGQEIKATVTCALTQVAADHTVSSLLEFLEETLDEAKRYGGNRTFMHDGTSPTPVVPPELNFAPQLCAI